jgi:hypothetical protein
MFGPLSLLVCGLHRRGKVGRLAPFSLSLIFFPVSLPAGVPVGPAWAGRAEPVVGRRTERLA